ncbi:MAG TPA: rhomboid family intramembrane serine protease [Casimicrobiaceae bacterium]|nr:rhomboid family intramembrane serine protease [Casimicrobiaceae bacterium]
MPVRLSDPTDTASVHSRAGFRRALLLALGFVALLWLIEALNVTFDLGLERFGVQPRDAAGLLGIPLAPLLHGGVAHLLANSLPLLIVGTAMLHLYPQSARIVLPAVYFGPGIAVWLVARGGVHVGASGLIYGLASYVFVAGVIRRDRRAIAASLLVSFLYGSLTWGVLPTRPEVSWETHLAAALIGVALALVLRRRDVLPGKRYTWEDEPEPASDESASE